MGDGGWVNEAGRRRGRIRKRGKLPPFIGMGMRSKGNRGTGEAGPITAQSMLVAT